MASVAAAAIAVFVLRDFLSRSTFVLFAAPVAIGVFVGVGLLVVHLNGLIRAARADAQRYASQMEEQAMELEETHRALEASASAQLAEAQSLARLGSWEWDIAGDKVIWSDEMYRLYGLEPGSEVIDFARYQSLLHPDDRDQVADVVARAIENLEDFSYDHRVVRADGPVRIFHARGRVIVGPDGTPIRMLGTGQDVTESRRAEAALRNATEYAAKQASAEAAARHLNRVFAQAPVVIAVLKGSDHTFELANASALELLGAADVLGKNVKEVVSDDVLTAFGSLLDNVYTTGEPFVGRELPARFPGGPEAATRYFNFVFQPLSDEAEVYGVLVVATEVTDLVGARIKAEQAQNEAMGASRAKSDFLARMSHELRTPLAAIIGYGELLADGITGPVNEEQKKQLMRIRWSANHLLSIIDEILTLARMEAGKERVDAHDVEVPQLLESVASMAEPLAAAKGLRFNLDLQPDEITVMTDPVKLRQVLLNLISNAVKYTDSGAITLSSHAADGQVHFHVDDTGIGVSPEHIEKIFEPFWQVEQTTTRRAGGTGLGLAVTREFVDLLGGSISVESEVGRGSSFRVTLPRA